MREAILRIPARLRVDPDTNCWLFIGKRDRDGYGILAAGGTRTVRAHIVVYEAARGPVPAGHLLHHRCLRESCVNPWHLTPMTIADHTRLHARMVTHCARGHERNEQNTRRTTRHCRVCQRLDARARYHANREEINARRRLRRNTMRTDPQGEDSA